MTSTCVESNSEHVVVGVWSLISTGTNFDLNRNICSGQDVVDSLEVKSRHIIKVVVSYKFLDVHDSNTKFLPCLSLLIICDWHNGWVVVRFVSRCVECILENKTDLTEVRTAWTNLVDTVVIEVVNLPCIGCSCSIWNERESYLVFNDGYTEVVLIRTLAGRFDCPLQFRHRVVDIVLHCGQIVCEVGWVQVVFHERNCPRSDRC